MSYYTEVHKTLLIFHVNQHTATVPGACKVACRPLCQVTDPVHTATRGARVSVAFPTLHVRVLQCAFTRGRHLPGVTRRVVTRLEFLQVGTLLSSVSTLSQPRADTHPVSWKQTIYPTTYLNLLNSIC